ncbi:TPA: hypothetical protein N0F65_009197 [Lagenidium giganteum]|uniref:Cytochrome b5 heme-binding domain-containing protein n=1 Tax=Lagenidium giganteum TaxID=4803 RepID=A0AAV2YPU2_9STRA|nr:TPA: hypothetical protein N0F65_009197 [Lagenidium giganteum]
MPDQRYFTQQELHEFNGTRTKKIYIALLGEVFDVSADSDEYGPGGPYEVLAGCEASRAVATMRLTPDEASNLELGDLTEAQRASLDKWVNKFRVDKKYPSVGRLLVPQDLTLAELARYDGGQDPRGTVLVGINGTIYDVTLKGLMHYGPGGTYAQFAGKDASRALACMSFDEECLSNPSLDDLTPEQQQALADWATRFQQKYVRVGKLL